MLILYYSPVDSFTSFMCLVSYTFKSYGYGFKRHSSCHQIHILLENYDKYNAFYDIEIPGCFGIPEGWKLEVGLEESVN